LVSKETLTPFNCRRILEAALAVDPGLRVGPDYPFVHSVIARLWPECLALPINPKPPVSWAKRARRIAVKSVTKLFK
jgi:hypothetical protein